MALRATYFLSVIYGDSVVHIRVTLGHLRVTMVGEGHFRVTIGHFRITICNSFSFLYSLSKHKANTTD